MLTRQSSPSRAHEWNARTIRALRAFLGWSQNTLARDLGIRQQTVSEWETGMYRPRGASVTILSLLAQNVGFDPSTADEPTNGKPRASNDHGLSGSTAPRPGLLADSPARAPAMQSIRQGAGRQTAPAGPAYRPPDPPRAAWAPLPEEPRYPPQAGLYSPGEEVPM